MFDLGTKIIVLSSTQKNGAGPRKGSIGYVVSVQDGYLIEPNMLASSCMVHFNRFGFEQKYRSEVRTVINLLPLINNPNETSVSKQIETFHNYFNSTKFNDMVLRIIDTVQANTSASIVVMAPYNEIDDDMLTCADAEFELWARMIFLVTGPEICRINDGFSYVHTNNPYISKEKIQKLCGIYNNRIERDLYIKKMTELYEEKHSFVLTVRYLLSMQHRSSYILKNKIVSDLVMHELHHTYANGRPTHATAKMIYSVLYNNLHSISFKNVTSFFLEKPGKDCVKNTVLMKSELKSMSEKLLSENTSN